MEMGNRYIERSFIPQLGAKVPGYPVSLKQVPVIDSGYPAMGMVGIKKQDQRIKQSEPLDYACRTAR